MNSADVLIKTEKGAAELAQRTGAVSQKLRATLIMVDGKTSWGDLRNRYSGLPEINEHLLWLVNNGFLATGGQPTNVGVSSVQDHSTFTLSAKGRAGLIELAHHLLGEQGGKVIQRIQETEDAHDALVQALERCCKLIRLSIDESKAELFRKQGLELLA